jgi:two-component system sensor histidine kinase DegS
MSRVSGSALLHHSKQQALGLFRSRYFWIVVGTLALGTILHYLTPQERSLSPAPWSLTRHTLERIIFLLPVVMAAFAFGRTAGVVVLALSGAIMVPRIVFISPTPVDALIETLAVVAIGGAFIWAVDVQEKEKRLRQKTVEKMETLNTISATLCQAVDLDETLDRALDKILEIVGNLEPKGAIFLLDPMSQNLRLRAHHGFSPELLAQEIEVPLGHCLCGTAAKTGEVMIVPDALHDPRHSRCLEPTPHSHVCIPLRSKEQLLGVIDLYLYDAQTVDRVDRQVFASLGRQIGVAVENIRLCENLRFYIRQITRAQEDERKRIARELHDETAQGLIDISRRLDRLAMEETSVTGPSDTRLENLQERIEELLQGVRRFSRDLRPSVLDDLGLLPALEGLMADVRQSNIEPLLLTQGSIRRLPPDAELALFRIVQEALNNVKKHSGASQVTVNVEFFAKRVRVTVHDNGRGFQQQSRMSDLATMGKFGMVGMEERAQLLGGCFAVLTGPGTGTILIADIPA